MLVITSMPSHARDAAVVLTSPLLKEALSEWRLAERELCSLYVPWPGLMHTFMDLQHLSCFCPNAACCIVGRGH